MDFLALPRRDLQALCKRNGVRANMTSAAMADALRALPKVDGIEEYVKQPVPEPEPEVKAALVKEQQHPEKQGSQLPPGRRVVARSSEPIEPEEDSEEEKGKAKRQPDREHVQELGVGRRGASRRARPVPVVPQLAAVAEEDKQGQEDLKRGVKRENAPAPVVGRPGGPSRRARSSTVVAAPADESEGAGAEEEKGQEEIDGGKRQASMGDAPELILGRRVGSRRARPVPAVAAPAGKLVAEEEQRARIPNSRRGKAKSSSTEPIRLDDCDDEEKEDAKPEEKKEDAPILGMGRRGVASRRALAAAVVAAPAVKAEEEQRLPIPRARRVKAKSTEHSKLGDSKEEDEEDMKPNKEKEDAPAIGVGRRGASRRAPALLEAPATRRSAATSKMEADDVARDPVPVRVARHRKPTMKAVAAAEAKAQQRATRRGAVGKALLQLQEDDHEEPQEAVPAPVSDQRCDAHEALEVVSDPQNVPQEAIPGAVSDPRCDAHEELEVVSDRQKEELNNVDAPKQEEEDLVITEDEKLIEEAPAEEPPVTDQECMEKSELQEQQVDDVKCPAPLATQEDSTVTQQASEDGEGANFQDGGDSSAGLLDKGVCEEIYDAGEEMVMVPGVRCLQAQLTANESDANHESEIGSFNEVQSAGEEISEGDAQDDLVAELPADIADEAAFLDCSGNLFQVAGDETNVNVNTEVLGCQEEADVVVDKVLHDTEEISEVDALADLVSKEKEHTRIAELQADVADESVFLHSSRNISQVAGEKTFEEVNTEDGLGCQEEGDVVDDKVLHDTVDNTILLDCSSDISSVEVKKAGNITSEVVPVNPAALDEDSEETAFCVSICDTSMSQVTVTDEVVQDVKGALITDEMPQGTAAMHDDIEDDQFKTVFVQADEVVTVGNLPEIKLRDCEFSLEENTALIVDEKQQSSLAMDEDVIKDHSETDGSHADVQMEMLSTEEVPELSEANFEVVGEKTPPVIDEKQKSTVTMDKGVVNYHFKTDVHGDEPLEVATTDKVPQLKETDDEVGEVVKTPLIVDVDQQSTITMNGGDIVDDHSRSHVAHADEQKEVAATEVTEVTGNAGENLKTPLIVDEKKQSIVTIDGDVVLDHFETDIAHTGEQKEIISEVPDDEVVDEKAAVIPNITHTMDQCVKENHFGTDFVHGNEQKKSIAADIEPEFWRTQDGTASKENSVAKDLPQKLEVAEESSDPATPALLDDATASLSKSNITMELEPSVSVAEDTSVCKSSVKNTAEPMAVLEEKGVKVTKKSVDLSKLSLGQLRAKLKDSLNAKKDKEVKRVALARVDENVCRSHAKGQQQNLNEQHH